MPEDDRAGMSRGFTLYGFEDLQSRAGVSEVEIEQGQPGTRGMHMRIHESRRNDCAI
jgi:hypothetical protein